MKKEGATAQQLGVVRVLQVLRLLAAYLGPRRFQLLATLAYAEQIILAFTLETRWRVASAPKQVDFLDQNGALRSSSLLLLAS